jgi:hypothetical protein
MSIIFLLPAVLSLVLVARDRLNQAFLWVYLPCLLVLPDYYVFRIPHLPPFSAAQAALIPIAIAALPRWFRMPLSLMDLLVPLYVVSQSVSLVTRDPLLKEGILSAAINIIAVLFAYIAGRTLIEPDSRVQTTKQFVLLVLSLLPLLAYEFRMGTNPYSILGRRLGLDFGWSVQLRHGYARISGSFSDAEIAGIAFGITFLLIAWLGQVQRADSEVHAAPRLGPGFTKLQRYQILGLIALTLLLLTQSRGPALGAAIGVTVLQIRRFRNRKLGALVVAAVLTVGLFAAYQHFSAYTNSASENEEQGSVAYRFMMNERYQAIVEQGGWLGWGSHFPRIPGLTSIDNEYLLVHLRYGELGYILALLIVAGSIWRPLILVCRFKNQEDSFFALTILACLASIWVTAKTVFLGEQIPQITFLLVGWSQSLTERKPQVEKMLVESSTEQDVVRVFC